MLLLLLLLLPLLPVLLCCFDVTEPDDDIGALPSTDDMLTRTVGSLWWERITPKVVYTPTPVKPSLNPRCVRICYGVGGWYFFFFFFLSPSDLRSSQLYPVKIDGDGVA